MNKPISSVYKWTMHKGSVQAPDPKAVADAERRARQPDTRDNTGRLLGGPPPGRSALDKKRAAEKPQPPPDWLADAIAEAKDEVTADE